MFSTQPLPKLSAHCGQQGTHAQVLGKQRKGGQDLITSEDVKRRRENASHSDASGIGR
jgi:hypothetical protein